MLTKTIKALALILCLTVLLGLLAACGGKETGILPEVKDYFGLDEAAEKQIEEMFAAFDSAFETLASCKPVKYIDLKSYGDAICEAAEATDNTLSETVNQRNKTVESADQETKDNYNMIRLNYMDVVLAQPNSYFESYETYAEDAITFVNSYSNLFYGTERIGEEDKNQIDFDSAANKTLLPFCLQFGNSYDECAQLHDMPELAPASGNAGYFCSGDYSVMFKGFFNGFTWKDDVTPLDPMAAYSFNEEHLLYEYYYITKFESENTAERAFNSLKDWLAEELSAAANVTENGTLAADFSTPELGASINLEEQDSGVFRLYVVLHSIPYDLNH